MKKRTLQIGFRKTALALSIVFTSIGASAQTNVFDDIIVPSPNHTYLEAALLQEGLEGALQNNLVNLTVFAPTDQAFIDIATALNTDIAGLLALPNLTDILTYHVLESTVPSSGVTNGAIVQPMSLTNTLKLTVTSMGDIYVNQAPVSDVAFDLTADNGVVHVLDAVVLPNQTVADIAIGSAVHTSLVTAVIQEELLPVLTDPLATLTVFAPTNQAFTDIATALNTDIAGLLALTNLKDILAYHVLGSTVPASAVTNGLIAQPLSTTNTLKLTVTSMGDVYVNQAPVSDFDLTAENGVVHILDAVVLPSQTVTDIAIGSAVHTSLVAAVIKAELLPALTNPLASLTVFAPTNQAFDALATALGTDLNGVLANPELADILLYHVVNGTVLSTDLANGLVPTLNGQSVLVDLTTGVMINQSNVTAEDNVAENGVVHIIDAVLVPSLAGIEESQIEILSVYPNPASNVLNINNSLKGNYELVSIYGEVVKSGTLSNNAIDVSELSTGNYFIKLTNNTTVYQAKFIKL